MSQDTQERIQQMVSQHRVILFMKGNPDAPQCGFSAVVANILKDTEVPFAAFDVLSDPSVRQGIKDFGNWPTIPQLYVDGELIGGCDIIRDHYERGEIKDVLTGQSANP
jgi:monothiol glutaredoxin